MTNNQPYIEYWWRQEWFLWCKTLTSSLIKTEVRRVKDKVFFTLIIYSKIIILHRNHKSMLKSTFLVQKTIHIISRFWPLRIERLICKFLWILCHSFGLHPNILKDSSWWLPRRCLQCGFENHCKLSLDSGYMAHKINCRR